MRHSALLKRDNLMHIFWTERRATPERILVATIDLRSDWMDWSVTTPVELLRPERAWEGARLPLVASQGGAIDVPVNQLRDPAIYEEDGRVYLLYSVAGERGIGLAEVHIDTP